MRFLKVVTSGLAVVFSIVAGVVATAVIAVAGLAIVLVARLFGRRLARVFQPGRHAEARRARAADVIDIAATEVPEQRLSR